MLIYLMSNISVTEYLVHKFIGIKPSQELIEAQHLH